jgi:hypothetical protein
VRSRDGNEGFIPSVVAGHGFLWQQNRSLVLISATNLISSWHKRFSSINKYKQTLHSVNLIQCSISTQDWMTTPSCFLVLQQEVNHKTSSI